MDQQQIGLKLALDALGEELSLNEFDQRLTLQKAIYLVQAAGVQLGFTYGWNLRGPYSPDLTSDAFALRDKLGTGTQEWKEWTFDANVQRQLARVRELLGNIPNGKARHLELLASVHFLLNTRQGSVDDVAGIRHILAINDKHFSEDEISASIEELKRHGLFPTRR